MAAWANSAKIEGPEGTCEPVLSWFAHQIVFYNGHSSIAHY